MKKNILIIENTNPILSINKNERIKKCLGDSKILLESINIHNSDYKYYIIDIIIRQKIDLLIIEDNPIYNEIIKSIVDNKETKDIPLIVITTEENQEKIIEKSIDMNLLDVIPNTININLLESKLNMYMKYVNGITHRKKVEVELKDTKDKLQSIIDKSPSMIYIKDLNGKYLLINKQFINKFNINPQAILNKTDHSLFGYNDTCKTIISNDKLVIDNLKSMNFEENIIYNGKVETYLSVKFPLKNEHNKVYAIGGISTNITEIKRVEKDLRKSERRYKAIVQDQTELIFRINPDGIITFVNKAFLNHIKANKNHIIGTNINTSIIFKDALETVKEKLSILSPDKKLTTIEHSRSIDKNIIIWYNWTVRAIFDDNSNLLEYQFVGKENTEKKLLEEATLKNEKRLEKFLDTIPLGTIVMDAFNNPLFINHKIYEFLNTINYDKPKNDALNKFFNLFMPLERYIDSIKQKSEKEGLKNKITHIESKELIIDDKSIPLEIWINPIFDDKENLEYIIIVFADISKKKQDEKKLKELNKKLINSNKELSQFAYIASHDLKEPLRVISGFAEILSETYANSLDEEALLYLHNIEDGVSRMDNLINDLLEYSRVQSKERKFKLSDFKHIINNVMNTLSLNLKERNAKINYDNNLPKLKVDPIQIESVFLNLINNAVKFVDNDKKPEIKISAKEEKEHWLFSVADNGIGIEKQYAEKIFIAFKRLHTRDEYEGTGIGLAICKKIIEKHKGNIWVESTPGKGSIFYFSIPKD
ncbi:MAG: PAS domain-containing sensor histidine kinase, partial [Spirochaetota bacterium]